MEEIIDDVGGAFRARWADGSGSGGGVVIIVVVGGNVGGGYD